MIEIVYLRMKVCMKQRRSHGVVRCGKDGALHGNAMIFSGDLFTKSDGA
jgi:hypothetical protein